MDEKKCILITGVSKGLGRALVEEMTDLGHWVCGCARSASAINALENRFPAPHKFAVVDVSKWKQVDLWINELFGHDNGPDLVVNNAGVINPNAPLWEVPDDVFSAVMNINVCGTANVIRAVLPVMIRRGSGIVVNFSSGWGRSAAPEVAPYCASKWAIEGLTRALAMELPENLGAVAVNPGIIDTDMLRRCWADAAAGFPEAGAWSKTAASFLLSLSPKDNGKSLTIG